jgi:SAM-dependent methyltransferase
MTERWQEYFAAEETRFRSPLDYAVTHWNFHAPLYHYLRQFTPAGGQILDIGCGPGYSDIYLQSAGYSVVGIDNDAAIVDKANANAELFRSDVRFEVGDAFDLKPYYASFDTCYSIGVIEHFDRDVTVQLLREQAKCARRIVAVIPTKYVKYTAGHTDERLYTIRQLASIFEEAGLGVVARFGYGDLPVGIHIWIKRLLPYGVYRLLQNRWTYAPGIACVGTRNG